MSLRDYLMIVRKRWLTIATLAALGVAGAVGATLSMTPTYVSSTQLYVSVQGGSTTNDMLQGASFTRQQVASYARLVTSPLVLGPVIDELGLDARATSLAAGITSDSPQNSSLININVTDESPAMAAAIANAVAAEFQDVVAELERPNDGSPSTVKLTIVRDAVAPNEPSLPRSKLNLALGMVVGLGLGVAVAFLREVLDTRVRDEASIAQVTSAPVMGAIVYDDEATARPLIVQSDPQGPRAEAFRRLRTNVQFLDVSGRPKSIVVTSSVPGEGKSTTTVNLAIALADAGTRVALVDADLRRPSVARYLGIEGAAGLTTALIGRASLEDVLQPWGNGMLNVLPSGQIPPNPSELLGSAAMSGITAQLLRTHDVVLFDTPPLLPVTDAAVLARSAGGALVVAASGRVHRHQLAESLSALEAVDARVLGIVMNMEARRQSERYEYYRQSDEPESRSTAARRSARRRGSRASGARTSAAPPAVGPAALSWPAGGLVPDEEHGARPSPQHHRGSR